MLCSRLSGRHECLASVTPWCAGLFEYLLENRKPPSKSSCFRHAPYSTRLAVFLPDLVLPEVQEYNRQNPRKEPLVDPSSDVLEVTLLLSTWYRMFRGCNPPKDMDGLK